jgi:predicted TIM-barrel fold metal-dependent hydrolase
LTGTIHGGWDGGEDALALIDAHHHLWDLSDRSYPWLCDKIEPAFFLGDYAAIRRDYLPDDYRRDAAGHRVVATVHCEAEWRRDDPVAETRWVSGVSARHGFPNAIVAHAWLDTPDADEVLAAQAAFPLVRGIRSKPVTSPAPGAMVPGAPGTMQDRRWLDGFARLGAHGLSYDLRVPFWHLAEAAEVARAFPGTPIALNHTGLPLDRSEEGLALWRRGMEALARAPNVHVKVSEFGLPGTAWDYEANRRVVLEAIAIFGIERCMFASNFPVAGLRISYDALVRSMARMLAHLPRADQARFFAGNAADFYRIALPAAA